MDSPSNFEAQVDFVFESVRSMREWRRRTARPAEPGTNRTTIPLPPGISERLPQRLDTFLGRFRRVGGARACPVEAVLGAGPFGLVAARLFAHLTGAAPPRAAPVHALEARVARRAQSGLSLVICADPSLGEGGLNRLALAMRGALRAPGMIYAVDIDSAVMQAVKAAYTPAKPPNGDTWLVDTVTRGWSDLSAPGWRATPAHLLTANQIGAALRNVALPIKAVLTHGNGFDFDLGEAVMCGFATDVIPRSASPAMFSCLHTGACLRVQQTRLHPGDLDAEVLILASCTGVLDAPAEVDLSVTAFAGFAASPDVRSIITTAHYWVAAPEAGLRLLEAVAGSQSLGELVVRLNTGLDPFARSAFLLFGNPEAPAPRPADLKTRRLDSEALQAGLILAPGLHRIAGPADGARRCLIVLGGGSDPPRVRFATAAEPSDALLIFNSEPVYLLEEHPEQAPALADQTLARAQAFLRFCDQLLPTLADPEVVHQRRAEASDLIDRARSLERATEEHRAGTLQVATTQERALLHMLDADSDQLSRALVKHFRDWSVGGPMARFLVSVWRSVHRQVRLISGRACPTCQAPLREPVYDALDGHGGRRLVFCPSCSTVADIPHERTLTVTIRSYQLHADQIDLAAEIACEEHCQVQICAAAFLMSRYEVWTESAGPVQLRRPTPGDTWFMSATLEKPNSPLLGEHWLVLVGLIDGVPFTAARKVLIGPAGARDPVR